VGRQSEDGLGGGGGAGELAGDAAAAHHEDAVGEAEELGELGGDEQDALACGGEFAQEGVDFGLGADVDAARGFVDDEQARVGEEPARDEELLLVAAGEGRGGGVRAAPLEMHPRAEIRGGLAFVLGRHGEAHPEARIVREGDVPRAGKPRAEPGPRTVLGEVADAGGDGFRRAADAERAAAEEHLAGEERVDAEDRLGRLAAAGADESGEADDLAFADGEGDVVHAGGLKAARLEEDGAGRRVGARRQLGDRPRGRPLWLPRPPFQGRAVARPFNARPARGTPRAEPDLRDFRRV